MGRDAVTTEPRAFRRCAAWFILCAILGTVPGCRSTCLPGFAAGPFAGTDSAAVAQADIERAWDEWATRNLQTGDIVFRMGVSRVMLGMFDVSRFSSELADSDYSHTALVVFEDGRPWVYDICRGHDGRRMPFSAFLMEYKLAFGIKRLKPEYRHHIPGAVAYCQHVYETRVPFDADFRLNNGRLYCTEMIEGAFRSAGLALSEPLRIDEFPNFDKHPTIIRVLQMYSTLTPDQPVLIPGNESIGMWASDKLELVLAARNPLSWPPAE